MAHRTWKRPDWAKGLTVNVSDEAIKRTEEKAAKRILEKKKAQTRRTNKVISGGLDELY